MIKVWEYLAACISIQEPHFPEGSILHNSLGLYPRHPHFSNISFSAFADEAHRRGDTTFPIMLLVQRTVYVSTHRVWVWDDPFLPCCPIAPSNSSFFLRVTATNHSEQRIVLTKWSNYLFLFYPVCMAPNSPLNNSVRNVNFAVSVLLSLFLVVHFSLPESKFGLIQYLVAHFRSRINNPPNKSSSSYSVKKIECCVAHSDV